MKADMETLFERVVVEGRHYAAWHSLTEAMCRNAKGRFVEKEQSETIIWDALRCLGVQVDDLVIFTKLAHWGRAHCDRKRWHLLECDSVVAIEGDNKV